jgi:acyl homoserine lactone synthase
MIQIIQAGQAGKVKYLLDMHRLRARIFKERMGWDVNVDMQGLEVDDFDIPEAIYLLCCNDQQKVTGCWRMLPTSLPTMIETVWPDFLEDIDLKKSPGCWETSRFAVDFGDLNAREGLSHLSDTTAKMFCALTELCILCDVYEIYTLYDLRISRILRRLNCVPEQESRSRKIDGNDCFVGRFIPDHQMLENLRAASGIQESLISRDDLPPILAAKLALSDQKKNEEEIYAHA